MDLSIYPIQLGFLATSSFTDLSAAIDDIAAREQLANR